MSERSYRIRTNLSDDKVVRLKVEQDYDFLEVLSLKIKQEDTYKLHSSNYGVIVGRVLANDAFGIPNAKVSVFIKLDDTDRMNTEITNIYPYTSFQTKDADGRRYNLLSDESTDECYQVVGTFPNKRLVLDNDTQLEIFEKYWKYTTVTNKSGDYMIFGVPTGGHQIHVDIDLSDIGILSQKPIDFIYKGYNATQFENAQQFKSSNNLDNLTQLLSQNQSVHVYPFWGDENVGEIAISRCDIQVQYKFEPTCIFFGAIMTDNYNNNIGHKCSATKYAGFNRHLVTGEGTIEMIRKTQDNLVEEFQIQGNRLIDGDGVWCYQIPMNLDFVGTDEFGNIIPTDNPNKGIPTRTSVRFRVSMQETGNEGVSRHRAKYLIPNVQDVLDNSVQPKISNSKNFEQCYEFGSATPDEYYRDLYWNKVYSVKNYIPRLQTNGKSKTQNYSALRTVNSNNDVNPLPFNHGRFRLSFAYRVLCVIMEVVFSVLCAINALVSGIAGLKIWRWRPFKWVCNLVRCTGVRGGLTEEEDSNKEYFPCCTYDKCAKCENKGCTKVQSYDQLINVVQQSLSQEYDTVNLDFYNDWLNGSLYMPLWFWKKTKKKKFLFGLFSKKAVNSYCSCGKNFPKLRLTSNCVIPYGHKLKDKHKNYHEWLPSQKTFTIFGVIKEFVNRAGLNIYYYAPGIPNVPNFKELEEPVSYVRLYSTDIILLGSLNSCDLDNYPNVFTNLPTTTANVPFIATITQNAVEEDGATYLDGNTEVDGLVEVTGMDWLHKGEKGEPKYGAGLFMDLACTDVYTKPKTCINLERMCELGVTLDTHMEVPVAKNGTLIYNTILADGMITRYEIVDNESRAIFASLNNNGFKEKVFNSNTGYYTYKLRYVYPMDFDGRMYQASDYTNMMEFKTYDNADDSYLEYRFGPKYNGNKLIQHFYSKESGDGRGGYAFPLFNNSFYFYFGIHEGSTAIDKFNSRFYATCYRNMKYPFSMLIESEPAKWCAIQDKDYGTINVSLNGIKVPYTYKLHNEFNEEILNESGIYVTELKFGYKIKEGGGEYDYDTNGKLIKNGYFSDFTSGEKTDYKVENGVYKLEIVDTNGNIGTQNIILDQVPIGLLYETVELGDKFYDTEISKESDFCNANQFFGEIRISGVTIDGNEYRILNNGDVVGGNGEYNLTVTHYKFNEETGAKDTSTKNVQKVKITIMPQTTNDDGSQVTFKECTCHGVGGFGEAMIKGGYVGAYSGDTFSVLYFPIWRPSSFKIIVNQYCNDELNDNVSEIIANVKNGEPFNAYINGMPMKFILGKNEQINLYNTNFYKVGATLPTQLPGWFGLHKEKTYCFSATTMQYEPIWSDFTTVSEGRNMEDEEDVNYYLTEESLYNILEFKFKKMFSLSNGAYVTADNDAKLYISHSGGKTPILHRGNYPMYSEITGEETPDDKFNRYIANSDGSVSCLNNYANIVGNNYSYIQPKSGISVNMYTASENGPLFNKIYSDFKNLGNYFATFTRNGSIVGEETCTLSNAIKYQQIPYKASPQITGDSYTLTCLDDESESNKLATICYNGKDSYKPYFRGEFVDRRLDYNFIILTPYAGTDVVSITSGDTNGDLEPIWKKGRISGSVINGIEMVYDNNKDYNVIGANLEYYYKTFPYTNDAIGKNTETIYNPKIKTSFDLTSLKEMFNNKFINIKNGNISDFIENGINIVDKRYYKTILKCSNKSYDINNMYWAYDGGGNITYFKNFNNDFLKNKGIKDSLDKFDVNLTKITNFSKLRSPEYYGYELVNIGSLPTKSGMFAYNHTADTSLFNGDFSVTNYPLRRLLDIGNVPSCDKITFNCSSCSYDIDVNTDDGSEEISLVGTTSETDELEFIVDCRNMITPELMSLEEATTSSNLNNTFNVNFKYDKGKKLCTSNSIRIRCRVKQDSYNTTHDVYTEFPFFYVAKWSSSETRKYQKNIITLAKNESKDLSELIKNLSQGDKGCMKTFTYDDSTVKDLARTRDKLNKGQYTFHIGGYYWVTNEDRNVIAYDDNTNVKNVVYKFESGISNVDVGGVFLKRNYLNNSGDNLTKNISTIQFTSIYDVRQFNFDLCCAEEAEVKDGTADVTTNDKVMTDVSVSVGSGTNDSGFTTGVSSTTSATTENIDSSGETTTKVQHTIFKLTTKLNDYSFNQGFVTIGEEANPEDDGSVSNKTAYTVNQVTAVLIVRTGKKEYKKTNNVILTCEQNGSDIEIYADCYWSGDLSGYYLHKKNKPYKGHGWLYFMMPNKLMYRIAFNFNDFNSTISDCCEKFKDKETSES